MHCCFLMFFLFLGKSFQHPMQYENIKNEDALNSNTFDNATAAEESVPGEEDDEWDDLGNNLGIYLSNFSYKDYDDLLPNDTDYLTSMKELLDTTESFISSSFSPSLNNIEEENKTFIQPLSKTAQFLITKGSKDAVTEESPLAFFIALTKPIKWFRKTFETTEKVSKENGSTMVMEEKHSLQNTEQTTEQAITRADLVFDFTLKANNNDTIII
ncbi:hypothetical protein ILUMI_23133 [Ignelater luminosus]|uniref:Uncharacterized protein n=1 Tax=Ignelater luminosus TaxID=2038154 RepID=A0A8K0CCL6_IGNLU|nr:hypothetical protein ILUMI_23133 [Ignelater luminosus]